MERDEPLAIADQRHHRFREYLNTGVTQGYLREAACADFLGQESLERMVTHPDPQEREFNQDIYHFVRGTYQQKPLE